jgi:hypothetical protein
MLLGDVAIRLEGPDPAEIDAANVSMAPGAPSTSPNLLVLFYVGSIATTMGAGAFAGGIALRALLPRGVGAVGPMLAVLAGHSVLPLIFAYYGVRDIGAAAVVVATACAGCAAGGYSAIRVRRGEDL